MIEVRRVFDHTTDRLLAAGATCRCGAALDMTASDDTGAIDCPCCWAIYNSSGQELLPRSQWEDPIDADY